MPKKKNPPNHGLFDERKRAFLQDFAREAPQIRESIVKDLPAYNKLLSLQATTFDEFALQQYAFERKTDYRKDTPPMPTCPHCGRYSSVGTKGDNLYRCRDCNKSFSANHNSISSGTKCDALTWMKVVLCLLDAFSVSKTCEYCDISPTTYYKIRNRLFYAMDSILSELRLYGVVEVDNTFVRCSYKGADLRESEFDEDSIFFNPNFIPRGARQRGGSYKNAEYNANNVCIFTAIDDHGHVMSRFAGIGMTNYQALKYYIPKEKFLLSVPSRDPFTISLKSSKDSPSTASGSPSLMVSDKEKAIEKYANHLGISFESHVYRKNGIQVALPDGAHNIQRVNALHSRLKRFLQKHNYVSTKYLPGYLVLFEFIENTGATESAIKSLFKFLSKPNNGKPSRFFDELYVVPNYLQEWLISNTPLSKLPYNKILAYYMFDQIKHKEDYPDTDVVMRDIVEETGYSPPSIRKFYRDLTAAGYRELILNHFNPKHEEKKPKPTKNPNRAPKTINPIVLAMYDEYAHVRTLPAETRPTNEAFVAEMNKRYGTNYKYRNLLAKFRDIENRNIRPPLPPVLQKVPKIYGFPFLPQKMEMYEEYQRIVLSYRQRGEKVPKNIDLYRILSEKFSLSPSTLKLYIAQCKKRLKENRDEGT